MFENATNETQDNERKNSNTTGIPDNMKRGFEYVSGYSYDDVEVYYNSVIPMKYNASAIIEGNNVYIKTGQEKWLPHELGHYPQQIEGVDFTKGVNTDDHLEKKADMLAKKALQSTNKIRTNLQSATPIAGIQMGGGNPDIDVKDENEEVLNMKYTQFIEYAKANTEWTSMLDPEEIELFQKLLVENLKGLSKINMQALCHINFDTLKKYSILFSLGTLNDIPAIQFQELDNIYYIDTYITYLEKIMPCINNIQQCISFQLFEQILKEDSTANAFLLYCKAFKPCFENEGAVKQILRVLTNGNKIEKSFEGISTQLVEKDILFDYTFKDFEIYATEKNIEWANLEFLDSNDCEVLWELLDISAVGLSKIKLFDILSFCKRKPLNVQIIKMYSESIITGKLVGKETIQLHVVDNIDDIVKHASSLLLLTDLIPNIKTVMSYDAFQKLMNKKNLFTSLICYCYLVHPVFQTRYIEINAFIDSFCTDDGNLIEEFESIATIKRYHVFSSVAIKKLMENMKDFSRTKPLTIAIVPSVDTTGSFVDSKDIESVILNTNINTIVLESVYFTIPLF